MNREFRVWDRDKKCMLYKQAIEQNEDGFILAIGLNGLPVTVGKKGFSFNSNQNECFIVDHLFERMDSTTLLDINGKTIYEGDIVRVNLDDDVEHICIVIWSDLLPGFCLQWKDNLTSFIGNSEEVIGNIYENKDLLTNV